MNSSTFSGFLSFIQYIFAKALSSSFTVFSFSLSYEIVEAMEGAKYEKEIVYISGRLDKAVEQREQAMLDCWLNRYSVTAAERQLGIHKSAAYELAIS
ncbi:hypothetical protein [Bacillus sp. PK3_68]|uniref:hypothetical protein n=1 Tax=Bacillus sp. PK3_68 TaxID=2027408 RepID=UPI000E70F410|nr:hypothetical protein [Bacillus sp. PK3_68]RJS59245.1 hypothetical protein CJ483_03495 [Bacillus sp. PK3_68]